MHIDIDFTSTWGKKKIYTNNIFPLKNELLQIIFN